LSNTHGGNRQAIAPARRNDGILQRGDLKDYRFAHAARADMCRRLGRTGEARASYQRALALTKQEPDGRFLERRVAELKFYLIEERDLNDAIQIAAKIPPAREGSIEVRPVRELNP